MKFNIVEKIFIGVRGDPAWPRPVYKEQKVGEIELEQYPTKGQHVHGKEINQVDIGTNTIEVL